MKNSLRSTYRTSGFERLSYGLYFFGQNIFYGIVSTFLLTYFTDIGIPSAIVAVFMLFVKLWDAINDPIFGGIVDKVRFKNGKFLPWLRISLLFIPIATILLFAIPSSISLQFKVIWAIIAYILWDSAYTVCDVPIFGLVTTLTENQNERTLLMSYGRVFGVLSAILVMVLIPGIRELIGGWMPIAVLLSIISTVIMAPLCFAGRERVAPSAGEPEIKVRDMINYIKSNKYLLIFFSGLILIQMTNIFTQLLLIFSRYCLGNEKWMTLLAAVTFLPVMIVGILMPAITKKIDKFTIFIAANIGALVLSVIIYFAGYKNSILFLVLFTVRSLFLGAHSVLMYMFTPDCVEYGSYVTGMNASGTGFAMQSFSAKLVSTIATVLSAALLSIIGFVEGENAVQAQGFPDKLWAACILVPAAGIVLGLLVLRKYKLRDSIVQIMAKANINEISRQDAERQLAGKY